MTLMVTRCPIPVFKKQDFLNSPASKSSDQGSLELVLPKNARVIVIETHKETCSITVDNYQTSHTLYTLLSFLEEPTDPNASRENPELPRLDDFILRIHQFFINHSPFLKGGILPMGTKKFHCFCPYPALIDRLGDLCGVDTIGLIHQASQGATPRNIDELLRTGNSVEIHDLTPEAITEKLQPGMIIGWESDVLIVGAYSLFQSLFNRGVVASNRNETIKQIMREREAIDEWPISGNPLKKSFVIRDLFY